MKSLVQRIGLGLLAATALLCAAFALYYKQVAQRKTRFAEWAIESGNSYAVTLFHLAGERSAKHKDDGKIWLMSIQDASLGLAVTKLEDDEFIVLLIPASDGERLGFLNYATHFNNRTLDQADMLAISGRHAKALRIYEAIKRFDSREGVDSLVRNRIISVRNMALSNVPHASDVRTVRALMQNRVESSFSNLETISSTKVSNVVESADAILSSKSNLKGGTH